MLQPSPGVWQWPQTRPFEPNAWKNGCERMAFRLSEVCGLSVNVREVPCGLGNSSALRR
jgi:hypothetical protein